MSIAPPTPLDLFCGQHGAQPPLTAEPIRAGRNSEVLRLRGAGGQWILKKYFQHPGDRRDRLGTEFGFLRFCKQHGVAGVPDALGMDRELFCALYSLLPGTRPTTLTADHITQAVGFILALAALRGADGAAELPLASEACLSWQAHLDMVAGRVQRLLQITPGTPVESAAHQFVRATLAPTWERLSRQAAAALPAAQLQAELAPAERILSPSDFGFHNALEDGGRLAFVDFEYAGWDDPAKLICDFICQPELPVSAAQGSQFRDELLAGLGDDGAIARRVAALLPLHRIKWCCILLNEFRIEDRQRRLHAGVDGAALLETQLAKAQTYFLTHLAT